MGRLVQISWARVHRWLAIVLVVPLVVWSVTGLLFHLKPGWDRAYDLLSVERPGPLRTANLAPVSAFGADLQSLELFDTALGPMARVTTATGTELVDAVTTRRRSPLSVEDARVLAADAVARSAHRAAYGDAGAVSEDKGAVHIHFAGGPTVHVRRSDARISQRGLDTDRIDWLYRVHYLQWTGNRAVDRGLAVFGLVLIWAVILPGLVLFVRRLR